MSSAQGYVMVLVTTPDLRTARRLARAALQQRLVACANLLPAVESHYWWKKKLEVTREVLILFKTERRRVKALQRTILSLHPYDTPEFIVLRIEAGARKYLDWITAEVREKHS